jgi:uncharacterized membrane protein YsdA (DUF1294 family)/cold shock CspA family protein
MSSSAHSKKPRNSLPMVTGTLVMWSDQKGFGFIRPEGTDEDYFVHISTFKKGLSRRPEIGDIIQFRPAQTEGKKRASFAMIPALEQPAPQPQGAKRFELNPRQRSWSVNLLIITPLVLSGYLLMIAKNPIPFFSYWIFSLLNMFLYGADKANAATRKWRVPEVYFHILEILGGWPGSLIAQNDFRHKTRPSSYLWILRGIIAIHLMAWVIYFYWTARQTDLGLF